MLTLALAGNPNCGKTALFNRLTGVRQSTGNWPGVTVDRKEGRFDLLGRDAALVDLPGIYSLDASSIDEQVTRDYLLSGEARLIVNVLDAANLERNLYFSVQLLEMGVPLVVALNMMDVARRRGIELDVDALAEQLGCPVVPVVAVSGEGLAALKQEIQGVLDGAHRGGFQMTHEDSVEQAITDLEPAAGARRGSDQQPLAGTQAAGGGPGGGGPGRRRSLAPGRALAADDPGAGGRGARTCTSPMPATATPMSWPSG